MFHSFETSFYFLKLYLFGIDSQYAYCYTVLIKQVQYIYSKYTEVKR